MDEYIICPFDSSHRILKFRMPSHIIKCKKNYKGEPLEVCPYNAQHYVKVGSLSQHLSTCKDYETANEEEFLEYYKYA